MLSKNQRTRGTTLVELLLATAFLGICVSAMLSAVSTTQRKGDLARYRLIAISLAEDKIAAARAAAKAGTLAPGTVNTSVNDSGIPATVSISCVTTYIAGGLYRFNVTVSFSHTLNVSARSEDIVLETLLRSPDV